eukprot:CAMPEP_0114534772 /NCGR_PEP_ID=MMETSP0109-20121206/28028_1 /TAXON_ID=29199 /ORGANISM="Chlorarachnion reptans, Strain CCCM449" /LENGTH=361 /DNA_ID=CAMNT_0001718227 /DNA_START=403 /DNA_END=1488 /DNA_ORIENTATION=-
MTVSGTRLVKAGSDARNALVIDVTWQEPNVESCSIDVKVRTVKRFLPNKDLARLANECETVLEHLRLVVVPKKFMPLDSREPRVRQNTAGSFFCTELRDALNSESPKSTPYAEAVLLAGGTRGGKLYRKNKAFSLEDLLAESGPRCGIQVIEMPGSVLIEAVRDSRTRGKAYTHFIHHDDQVLVDNKHKVTHVFGNPVDPGRIYRVGYSAKRYLSRNGPKGLADYFQRNLDKIPPEDAELPGDQLLLGYWAEKVWTMILEQNSELDKVFESLDTDGDGVVSVSELATCMNRNLGFEMRMEKEKSFVECILQVAGDENGDGKLTYEEFKRAVKRKADTMKRVARRHSSSLRAIKKKARIRRT